MHMYGYFSKLKCHWCLTSNCSYSGRSIPSRVPPYILLWTLYACSKVHGLRTAPSKNGKSVMHDGTSCSANPFVLSSIKLLVSSHRRQHLHSGPVGISVQFPQLHLIWKRENSHCSMKK